MSNRTEIIIDGNNKGAITAINGVKQELSNFGPIGNKISSMLSQIFNPTTLAIGAVTGLATIMKQAINTADELYMMSQRVGVSVESLSVLKYAAEQSDLSLEQMQTSLKKLSTNLYDVSTGAGKDAALTFNELGISVFGTDGKVKQADQTLLEIAERFARMTDGTEKSALAVKLFGRAGLDMIPFLNQGKDGIKALTDEAEKLGLKLSTETGAAAEQFNDDLAKIAKSLEGITYKLLPGLASEFELFSYTIEHGTWWEFLTFQDEALRQQIEFEKHMVKVNKVFYETFGIQNQIYPFMVDSTKKHNDEIKTQLKSVTALKDEYAKLVEVQAKGQPDYNASRAGITDQYKPDNPFGPFEMQTVETPLDAITEQSINFFDMYDERAQLMSQNTSDIFSNMGNAASMFYQASGQKAKQWFAIQKSFAIAQALINTYEGATKALAQGGFFGFAMAAAVITAGLANVAMIASQQPTSSGGDSARSSGGGVSSVGSQSISNDRGTGNYSAGQVVVYNTVVQGSVWDPGKFAREITPYINIAKADGVE